MPSVLYHGPDETLVGQSALNQLQNHPARVARSTKRNMGRGESAKVPEETQYFSPVGVASEILGTLAADASEYLNRPVTKAVITIPADFSDSQRRLTKKAAEMAGIEVQNLIAEPTAAALAYDLRADDEKTILVFDLGGGTFDASIIDLSSSLYEVAATRGDNQLGGDDWTDAIVEFLIEYIEREHDVTMPSEADDPITHARLWVAAEKMKQTLSSASSASSDLQYLEFGDESIQTVEATLSRDRFEFLTESLRDRLNEQLDELFDGSEYDPADLDEVLLVGGSTRMPQISEMLEERLGISPQRSDNPDEVVADGAATQAVLVNAGPALEAGATSISTGEGEVDIDDTVLLDAATRSLGLQTREQSDGRAKYTEIIAKDTTVPTTELRENFVPFKADEGYPGASSVRLIIYETPEANPTDDFREKEEMGELRLTGLDPTVERTEQRIDIEYVINEDNLLEVNATERTSGETVDGVFEPNLGYTEEELEAERERMPRSYEQQA